MKLVSYNLRSGVTTVQDNQWQHLMREFEPDLVFAQESLHPEKYFLPDVYGTFMDRRHEFVPRGKWGSAILSRRCRLEPVELSRFKGWVVGARTTIQLL